MNQEQDNNSFPYRQDPQSPQNAGNGFDRYNSGMNSTPGNGYNNYPGGGFNNRPEGSPQGFPPSGDSRIPGPGSSKGSGTGKKIGISILCGVLAGITATAIFLGTVSVTLPGIVENSARKFEKSLDKSIEKEVGKLPSTIRESIEENAKDLFRSGDDDKPKKNGSKEDADDNSEGSSASPSSAKTGGYLGVSCAEVRDQEDHDDMPDGVFITDVQQGSAASMAGIKANDIVTAVDGKKVSSVEELKAAIAEHKPDSKVTITVSRKNGKEYKESTHDAILTEWPESSSDQQSAGGMTNPFGQEDKGN
uniref:PDZ domain-containing protein n=1 Tax=Eubacterium cellulosolvens TaxID=29322 RepID=UPI0004893CC5|nr:PDZ domain-containing protein [[Eubacterium] cellulosolvens]